MSERRELRIDHLSGSGIPVINYANQRLNLPAIVIEAGFFDDPPYLEGAAHTTEHVVCGSSNTYTSEELALTMEELFGGTDGPDINIRTMWSNTLYSNLDCDNRSDCRRVFLLHASVVRDAIIEAHNNHRKGTTFSLDSILGERAAVRNEAAWRLQDQYVRVSEALHYQMYKNGSNPAKLSGTGNERHLRKLKPETLKSWAAQYYVPSRVALIGVGPKQNEMFEWAKEAGLDQIKPYKGPAPVYHHPDQQPMLSGVVEFEMEQPGALQCPNGTWIVAPNHLGLAWPTETFISDDGPALQVLARILKMRTEMKLRDENRRFDGGVYHPSGSWWSTKFHGLLELWLASTGDAKYVEEAEAAVLGICHDLKDDRSETLKHQCRAIRINLAKSVDRDWKWYPDRICERIVDHWTNGDREFARLYALRGRFMAVRPQDVRQVANKYLTADRYVRAVIQSVFVPPDVYERSPGEVRPYLKYFLRPAQ